MNWLSKIITGTADEYSHAKLVKYGIGTHPGPRAKITLSKARIAFKADLDYEKVFTRAYVKGAPEGSHKIKGIVRSYTDRIAEFDSIMMPLSWKRSKGKLASIFNAKLDEVAPLEHIRDLINVDGPTTFFLVSLNPRDGTKPWKITTKTSFPKGGGGGGDDDDKDKKEKDPVFTKGALANAPSLLDFVVDEILPDLRDKVSPNSKKISVSNTIVIEEIVPPDDPNLSFSEKRRLAKKRGKIIRKLDVDGEEHINEVEFFV
ncbi:MAG: hypothetical protein ACW974_10020 [Candidatus Thorarchaeota archaeon]|jgi:hypothetical protein